MGVLSGAILSMFLILYSAFTHKYLNFLYVTAVFDSIISLDLVNCLHAGHRLYPQSGVVSELPASLWCQ